MNLRSVAKFCNNMGWYTTGCMVGMYGATYNAMYAWLFVLAVFFWVLELVAGVAADRREAAK